MPVGRLARQSQAVVPIRCNGSALTELIAQEVMLFLARNGAC
jgi:hypothetical protein